MLKVDVYFEDPPDISSDITPTLIKKGLEHLELLNPFYVDNLENSEFEGYTKGIMINLIEGDNQAVESFETEF